MSLLTSTAERAIYDIITTTCGAVEVFPVKQSRVYFWRFHKFSKYTY